MPEEVPAADHQAQADLGRAYQACFGRSKDLKDAQKAADAFVRAAMLGLEQENRILYTRETAETLVQLRNKGQLQEVFRRFLEVEPSRDPDGYYLALLDYAGALATLGDGTAGEYFERAIEIHPQNDLEAINRYARYLIDSGQPHKAAELLEEKLTRAQRIRAVQPAYLRREALQRAGLDTGPADAEIAEIERGRRGLQHRVRSDPKPPR